MSAIHTPGPWEYLHPVGSDNFLIYAFDRNFTRDMISVGLVPNKVYTHTHGWPEHNERHANARLIAAAPDLLAALDALKRAGGIWPDLLPMVEAALAKAKGGAH